MKKIARINSTPQVIQACLCTIRSILQVTQRVPPTCTIIQISRTSPCTCGPLFCPSNSSWGWLAIRLVEQQESCVVLECSSSALLNQPKCVVVHHKSRRLMCNTPYTPTHVSHNESLFIVEHTSCAIAISWRTWCVRSAPSTTRTQ